MLKSKMLDRKDVARFIRDAVGGGFGQNPFEWDGFISCRHKDDIVDAASIIASTIGIACPPEHDGEWCSAEGRRRLLGLADAVDFE